MRCTHRGCGKEITDLDEECVFHHGAPIFHEGQKGWQCCKTRVLTFDEFLTIPGCTTGRHTTEPQEPVAPVKTTGGDLNAANAAKPSSITNGVESYGERKALPRVSVPSSTARDKPKEPEIYYDDPAIPIAAGAKCLRNGCDETWSGDKSRSNEKCVFHPGAAMFHEGSKGWTCCKRRVLDFDDFLKIEGCKTDTKHQFLEPIKEEEENATTDANENEEEVKECRNDFYQTGTYVHLSIFLKKVDPALAKITFSSDSLELDLTTTHSPKRQRYRTTIPLYGHIESSPDASTYKVMGTKVELKLKKADGASWPCLRSDDEDGRAGLIIQIGKPATA